MGISISLKIGKVKLHETLHIFKCQNVSISNNTISINQHPSNFILHLHQNLNLIFYPWMFHGRLTIRMNCNWPQLTMLLMVNEAWLFTFYVTWLWRQCCKELPKIVYNEGNGTLTDCQIYLFLLWLAPCRSATWVQWLSLLSPCLPISRSDFVVFNVN